jgi:hypothetical protein
MNQNILDRLNINYVTLEHDGETYYVTTSTGEMGFGRKFGGSAAFAYVAADVDAIEDEIDYSEFCQRVDAETDRDLAIACAIEGMRLTKGGSCSPVLSDAEFLAARDELVGERVESGKPGTEDEDAGTVVSVADGVAVVAWDSEVRTPCDIASLRMG